MWLDGCSPFVDPIPTSPFTLLEGLPLTGNIVHIQRLRQASTTFDRILSRPYSGCVSAAAPSVFGHFDAGGSQHDMSASGAQPPSPSPPLLGPVSNQGFSQCYHLLQEVSRGAWVVLYKARGACDGQLYTLKLSTPTEPTHTHPSPIEKGGGSPRDPREVQYIHDGEGSSSISQVGGPSFPVLDASPVFATPTSPGPTFAPTVSPALPASRYLSELVDCSTAGRI